MGRLPVCLHLSWRPSPSCPPRRQRRSRGHIRPGAGDVSGGGWCYGSSAERSARWGHQRAGRSRWGQRAARGGGGGADLTSPGAGRPVCGVLRTCLGLGGCLPYAGRLFVFLHFSWRPSPSCPPRRQRQSRGHISPGAGDVSGGGWGYGSGGERSARWEDRSCGRIRPGAGDAWRRQQLGLRWWWRPTAGRCTWRKRQFGLRWWRRPTAGRRTWRKRQRPGQR